LWLIVLVVVGLVFAVVTIGAQDVRGMPVVLVTALFGLFTTIAVAALGTVVAYALGHKQTSSPQVPWAVRAAPRFLRPPPTG
jgi:hypothetical protein